MGDLSYGDEQVHLGFSKFLLLFRKSKFDLWIARRRQQRFPITAIARDKGRGDLFQMVFTVGKRSAKCFEQGVLDARMLLQ